MSRIVNIVYLAQQPISLTNKKNEKFKFIFSNFYDLPNFETGQKSFYSVEYELVKFDFSCNPFFLSIFDDHKTEKVLNFSYFGVTIRGYRRKKLVIFEQTKLSN